MKKEINKIEFEKLKYKGHIIIIEYIKNLTTLKSWYYVGRIEKNNKIMFDSDFFELHFKLSNLCYEYLKNTIDNYLILEENKRITKKYENE